MNNAQLFTPEQLQAFLFVLASLVITNIGGILGAVFEYFRRVRKIRRDVNQAFMRIRALEEKQNQKQSEGKQ